MKLMDDFGTALRKIYNHVDFKEDWAVYPISDRTDMFWSEDGKEVKFADSMKDFNSDGNYYVDEIYKQRFYKKWVYRGKKLTLIIVDTHTDGNKFFAIYDNSKEIKEN
ncbi:MAG: hypothetical protein PVG39_02485 [Desulfobacteraceae bacterium]|jgi:hypothetical protein